MKGWIPSVLESLPFPDIWNVLLHQFPCRSNCSQVLLLLWKQLKQLSINPSEVKSVQLWCTFLDRSLHPPYHCLPPILFLKTVECHLLIALFKYHCTIPWWFFQLWSGEMTRCSQKLQQHKIHLSLRKFDQWEIKLSGLAEFKIAFSSRH